MVSSLIGMPPFKQSNDLVIDNPPGNFGGGLVGEAEPSGS